MTKWYTICDTVEGNTLSNAATKYHTHVLKQLQPCKQFPQLSKPTSQQKLLQVA